MKANRIENKSRVGLYIVLGFVVLALVAGGLVMGWNKLKTIYCEQFKIDDFREQVLISSGTMVKPDVIAEFFGLKDNANLATIDFEEKRREILSRIPTLRAVSIARKLPNRVTIVAEERIPIAKMGIKGYKRTTGRVVDSDGMVFLCQRGTQLLPTIYEAKAPGSPVGHYLQGRVRAALTLIEACREPAYADLGVQDVDISRPDFLIATLASYSRVKIAWEGMDEEGRRSRAQLEERLVQLLQAIRSQVGLGTKTWNATVPNRIFADSQEIR